MNLPMMQMPDNVAQAIDEAAKAEDPILYYRARIAEANLERDIEWCMRRSQTTLVALTV